jgi:hypothetical protein
MAIIEKWTQPDIENQLWKEIQYFQQAKRQFYDKKF